MVAAVYIGRISENKLDRTFLSWLDQHTQLVCAKRSALMSTIIRYLKDALHVSQNWV